MNHEEQFGGYSFEESFKRSMFSEKFINEDLGAYDKMLDLVHQNNMTALVDEIPENYVSYDISPTRANGITFMLAHTLKRKGYPIVAARSEESEHELGALEYFVEKGSCPSVYDIINLDNSFSKLFIVTAGSNFVPGPERFDPSDPFSYQNIMDNYAEVEAKGTHIRHFMFDVLMTANEYINGRLDLTESDGSLARFDQAVGMYESFRSQEHTPLGFEEVYGIISGAVDRVAAERI